MCDANNLISTRADAAWVAHLGCRCPNAIKTRQIIQGFDFRAPVKPSSAPQAAYEVARSHVKKLEEDQPIHEYINALAKAVKEERMCKPRKASAAN